MKILVTCPPMLGMIDSFRHIFEEKGKLLQDLAYFVVNRST